MKKYILYFMFMFPFGGVAAQSAKRPVVDSSKTGHELNFMISYGGDSKLSLMLPKINGIRKHNLKFGKPYYGLGLGLHGALITWYGSASIFSGIEKGIFDFETGFTHFRTGKVRISDSVTNGPVSQNLASLKLGIRIGKIRLKLVRSFVLSENIPAGQERSKWLDIGKINNAIWGIELQYIEFLNK